ncbi:hypothetical protein QYE76_036959 [Lolium multiflorum]|uniref:Transposase-associated domain-containing protein n=1 Tax=Lolium multiflorum TaxID=4521 RepID=A0AAD8R3F9_LOLMU|nr:hypothetical protein QYE76_036959 [Lolium multiflorum]
MNSFLLVAEANKSKQGFMCCPCLKCKNEKDYSCSRDIKSHLLRFGFMSSYNVWTKHGEEGVMMEDGDEEVDNDDQYRSMFSECDDTAMEDNEEEGGEEHAADDRVDDDLRRAISDARRDCGTDKERLQFDKMLEDHHKLLYPGCEDGQRKLGSILELLKWKAEVGVTDSGFEKLMIILKKLFPRNNELPVSTYEAKKLVCPRLDVQKIHACINDCILYRGEKYENLNKCPICGALRYKIRKDDPGDVEGEPLRKRVPAKVMWCWRALKNNIAGNFAEKLTFTLVPCAQQPQGTNLCGYYVCESIRMLTTEKHNDNRFNVDFMREKLQPHEHILGITEELAGLLMKEVIDDNGLFSPNRRNK